MIKSFGDTKSIIRNIATLPFSITEVREYLKSDISAATTDIEITQESLKAINDFEIQTGYILLDNTFNSSIYNVEYLTSDVHFKLTKLNIREVTNIKYNPSDWDEEAVKEILDPTLYIITSEMGNTPKTFKLKKNNILSLYPQYNNIEVNFKAGFVNNIFTNLHSDIKNSLILRTADLVDALKNECSEYKNYAFYTQLFNEIKIDLSINQN